MTIEQCVGCCHLDPQYNVCVRHLKCIEDIESCDPELPAAVLSKTERDRVILMIRNMRLAALNSGTKSTEYEAGFFNGWCTACGAILAALGDYPSSIAEGPLTTEKK